MKFKLCIGIIYCFFLVNLFSQSTFDINGNVLSLQQIQSIDNVSRLSYLDKISDAERGLEFFLWVFKDFIGNSTASQTEFTLKLYDQYNDSFSEAIEKKIASMDFVTKGNLQQKSDHFSELFILLWAIPDLMYDTQYFNNQNFANFLEIRLVGWIKYQGKIDSIVESGTITINEIRYGTPTGPYGEISEENLRLYYSELTMLEANSK